MFQEGLGGGRTLSAETREGFAPALLDSLSSGQRVRRGTGSVNHVRHPHVDCWLGRSSGRPRMAISDAFLVPLSILPSFGSIVESRQCDLFQVRRMHHKNRQKPSSSSSPLEINVDIPSLFFFRPETFCLFVGRHTLWRVPTSLSSRDSNTHERQLTGKIRANLYTLQPSFISLSSTSECSHLYPGIKGRKEKSKSEEKREAT